MQRSSSADVQFGGALLAYPVGEHPPSERDLSDTHDLLEGVISVVLGEGQRPAERPARQLVQLGGALLALLGRQRGPGPLLALSLHRFAKRTMPDRIRVKRRLLRRFEKIEVGFACGVRRELPADRDTGGLTVARDGHTDREGGARQTPSTVSNAAL